jgi:hypothetical protein
MTIARACECKTANMREIVKAEGGKKLQTASRRNRSGVNFVATIVFIMCHLVLLHVNLGTRHHLHFCTGWNSFSERQNFECALRLLSAVCSERGVHAPHHRDAGGVGQLSDQPADRREPETETARSQSRGFCFCAYQPQIIRTDFRTASTEIFGRTKINTRHSKRRARACPFFRRRRDSPNTCRVWRCRRPSRFRTRPQTLSVEL